MKFLLVGLGNDKNFYSFQSFLFYLRTFIYFIFIYLFYIYLYIFIYLFIFFFLDPPPRNSTEVEIDEKIGNIFSDMKGMFSKIQEHFFSFLL